MLRKCRSKKALLLRGDGDKSRAFLLDALKTFAKASLLKGNRAGDELLATAKDLVRQAKKNPSRSIA
jgi:hypothetical protein